VVARLSVADIFDQVRDYLDTDALNMPDTLLDTMLQRVWFEAINMEAEWRFLNITMTIDVANGAQDLPMAFTPAIDPPPVPPPPPTPAVRINYLRDPVQGTLLPQVPIHEGLAHYGTTPVANPVAWSDYSSGYERILKLWPIVGMDCQLVVAFYALPQYPAAFTDTFVDLPPEFDQALKTGLLAETYLREEDPELYDSQRQVYLNAMGSIRAAWKVSNSDPLVLNRSPTRPTHPEDRMARPRLGPSF
jgi:hypothetical protein